MKTRIVKTNMWRDSLVYPMNIDTKLIYLYLLTNERAGLTDFQVIILPEISLYTGIDESLVELCIKQLQERGLLKYYRGWVKMMNGSYVSSNYKGGNVDNAKLEELNSVPSDIRDFLCNDFNEFEDIEVPPQVPAQVPLNNKSKIINNKSKTKNQNSEFSVSQIEEAKTIVQYWNLKQNQNLKDNHYLKIIKNYIASGYSLEEVKEAIDNLVLGALSWMSDKSLIALFRQSNKSGACDYIADCRNFRINNTQQTTAKVVPTDAKLDLYKQIEVDRQARLEEKIIRIKQEKIN